MQNITWALIIVVVILLVVYRSRVIDTCYPRVYTLDPGREFYHSINDNKIPKIIHQLAPEDINKWASSWVEGHNSVKTHFPEGEYQHVMWTDEKIDEFVKNKYPQYYDAFLAYPYLINRIDMVRYMILYEYGGIYIDMDFVINQNFYNKLAHGKINLVESVWFFNEMYQNSMMASPKGEQFWINLLDIATRAMIDNNTYAKYIHKSKPLFTITMTGPRLLDALVSHSNIDKIQKMPYYKWGHHKNSSVYTKSKTGLKNL